MSSSFIQIKPIGTHPMVGAGLLPWHSNSNARVNLSESHQDFIKARSRVACNLFGRPERGAIDEIYKQEEKQNMEHFKQCYSFFELIPKQTQKPTTRPNFASDLIPIPSNCNTNSTTISSTPESRLSGAAASYGESLIEKELREHEMKLKLKLKQQRNKKIVNVNCNEKLSATAAGDRIKSRISLKLDEQQQQQNNVNTTGAAAVPRTFVDSSKCASGGGERPKPYARQQSSITDFFAQRKTVVCNNSRTASTVEETTEVLSHLLEQESSEVEVNSSSPSTKMTSNNSSSAININDNESPLLPCPSLSSSPSSSSSSDHLPICESENNESSHEQTLHTMTTDVSAELA